MTVSRIFSFKLMAINVEKLSNQLNDLHRNYDNILLLGDFNVCDTGRFKAI